MKYVKYNSRCYYDFENSSGDGFLKDDDELLSFRKKNSIEHLFSYSGKIDLIFEIDIFFEALLNNTLYQLLTLNYDFYDCHTNSIKTKIELYNNKSYKVFNCFNPDHLNFILKRIIKSSFVSLNFNDDNTVNMYLRKCNSIEPDFRISYQSKNGFKSNNTNNFDEYLKMIEEGIREIIEA